VPPVRWPDKHETGLQTAHTGLLARKKGCPSHQQQGRSAAETGSPPCCGWSPSAHFPTYGACVAPAPGKAVPQRRSGVPAVQVSHLGV